MDARRRQTEDKVSRLQSWPRQQRATFGGPDREAGDVEIARGVKTGHLRRLSADQSTSRLRAPLRDALDHRRRHVLVEFAGSKIIQEKQRLSALDDDVVDAHRHEVNADRVVEAALDRELHLCADAIVGGNKDRIDKPRSLEIEQSAESAEFGACPSTPGGPRERTNSVDDPVA